MNFSNFLKATERVIKNLFEFIEIIEFEIEFEKLTNTIMNLNVFQIFQNFKTSNKKCFESIKSNNSIDSIK